MSANKMKDVFYVRGLVGETRKTTIMVVAADAEEARAEACKIYSITGEIEVFDRTTWEGLLGNENLIIGFKE
jgi:hypothetical protein